MSAANAYFACSAVVKISECALFRLFSIPSTLTPTQTARPYREGNKLNFNYGIMAHVNDTYTTPQRTLWSLARIRVHDAAAVLAAGGDWAPESAIRVKCDTRHDSRSLMRPFESCLATHMYIYACRTTAVHVDWLFVIMSEVNHTRKCTRNNQIFDVRNWVFCNTEICPNLLETLTRHVKFIQRKSLRSLKLFDPNLKFES